MKTANRLLVVLHLWPQGLEEGDEPPPTLSCGVWLTYLTFYSTLCMHRAMLF